MMMLLLLMLVVVVVVFVGVLMCVEMNAVSVHVAAVLF